MKSLSDLYILLNHLKAEMDDIEQRIRQVEQDIVNIINRDYNGK